MLLAVEWLLGHPRGLAHAASWVTGQQPPGPSGHTGRHHERKRRRMRTIGFLGGMSWESSAQYYRLANELVRDRLGGLHSARCILYSVDFADIEELQTAGPLGGGRRRAGDGGPADCRPRAPTCCCCAPTPCTRSPTRSRPPSASRCCTWPTPRPTPSAAAGLTTVGLLGTAFTMEQDFYRDRLASHGLTGAHPGSGRPGPRPPGDLRRAVPGGHHRGITPGLPGRHRSTRRRGAEGIILGCTEIELLITADDCPVPIFATTACTWRPPSTWPCRTESPGRPHPSRCGARVSARPAAASTRPRSPHPWPGGRARAGSGSRRRGCVPRTPRSRRPPRSRPR